MNVPSDLGPWGARLYAKLGDLTAPDQGLGYPLVTYIKALADQGYEDLYAIITDQDDGTPGWAILLDPLRCPAIALPWLGQFVGVAVDTTLSEANQRAQIQAVGGWYRGSVPSMLAAAKPFLSGSKFTQMVERYAGDAYQILYITHTAETPSDPTAMQAAVIAQKPAGIILTFSNVVGLLWGDVKTEWPTWAAVKANYATWNDVRNGP